jgi:regulation of enolase protein 1 (concanavalin A-like superfamily)
MQNDLESTWPYPVSAEGSGSTGRVEFTYKTCKEDWSNADLGTASGDADYEETDEFEISSNGLSWGATDNTHMIYQELCGDIEIEARLIDASNFGSAGLMIRESMAAGAKKVAINRQQFGSFVKSAIRKTTNGFGLATQAFRPNQYWLKLVRNGDTFTGYSSVDGQNWVIAFSTTVSMNSCVQVGLYVESPTPALTSVAHFDNVCANGSVPLPPLVEDIGNTLVQSQSKADGDFDMFPNPAADIVNLDMEMFFDQDVELSVFNQLGQVVYHANLDQVVNKYHQFDSSNWPKGMYIVKLTAESGQEVSHKLIVQRKNK